MGLKLQNLEQNLATGLKVSEEGNLEKYDPDMEDILGALLDENIGSDDTSLSEEDKLRLLLLFSHTEKGSKFNQPSNHSVLIWVKSFNPLIHVTVWG